MVMLSKATEVFWPLIGYEWCALHEIVSFSWIPSIFALFSQVRLKKMPVCNLNKTRITNCHCESQVTLWEILSDLSKEYF